MPKIYLLTAPFDEDAKTGDGQYARSLELGFQRHYDTIPCTWLKRTNQDYVIPFPEHSSSIPDGTIPSAIVLQPLANEKTIISGYKLENDRSLPMNAINVNRTTVSPRTPKVLVKHDNLLGALTLMDIYSKKPTTLTQAKVHRIIAALEEKKAKLLEAIEGNKQAPELKAKKIKAKCAYLLQAYQANQNNIQAHCTLNEYLEAHLNPDDFNKRHANALAVFGELNTYFANPEKDLTKIVDKFTGIKDYVYDFSTQSLPYDLAKDAIARESFGFAALKSSLDSIVAELTRLRIRRMVAKDYPIAFKVLTESIGGADGKETLLKLTYNYGFSSYSRQEFRWALCEPMPLAMDRLSMDEVEQALCAYTHLSEQVYVESKDARRKFIAELQTVIANQEEPYVSLNERAQLNGFYGKRKLSAREGFDLGYQANQRDPLKPQVIQNLINKMKPLDDVYLDIHIRPPDCGVFITAQDIVEFQKVGIKVNLTIHEYKQNYTRRYLQQYTHDLMRQADTVQFFNAMDRNNAIIAATYGDCDKRNTQEPSGVAKKAREVGSEVELDKYPVAPYNLKGKSGLTVASQQLSTAPAHPLDVIEKPANILSFGTIRSGKGFEEALILAQLVKSRAVTIRETINTVPIVKLAGDPQDKELMQKIVEERFGKEAVSAYQSTNAYDNSLTHQERRDYWKKLVAQLNAKVACDELVLNNCYLEIHPWCEAHELLELKNSSKYVCRMDDMGMRNNGSAIISVLDVGIVYTKFGSVTDDVFIKGGQYGNAVDIGDYRYGKHSLLKQEVDFLRQHQGDNKTVLPKWLRQAPDSPYKRLPVSRDPESILDSIIKREVNQLQHKAANTLVQSDNYATVVEAQKLLTERFTLKNAVEHLLTNMRLQHLIVKEERDVGLDDVDPVGALAADLAALALISPPPPLIFSRSCPPIGFFASPCRDAVRLKNAQKSTNIDSVGNSVIAI